MHVNLVIATPGNSFTAGYVQSILQATQALASEGISWLFANNYSSNIYESRERTLNGEVTHDMLDSRPFGAKFTYDKLLWIDSDIVFTPEDLLKAYKSPYDAVSGAYIIESGDVVAYKELLGPALTMDYVKGLNSPEQVAASGLGFFCLKSGVVESLSRPWFQSVTIPISNGKDTLDFPIFGEDISFCKRIVDAGFKIYLDPSIKLIHQKQLSITWSGISR